MDRMRHCHWPPSPFDFFFSSHGNAKRRGGPLVRRNMRHPSPRPPFISPSFSPLSFPSTPGPAGGRAHSGGKSNMSACSMPSTSERGREAQISIQRERVGTKLCIHPIQHPREGRLYHVRRSLLLCGCDPSYVSVVPRCPAVRGVTLTPSTVHSFTSTYSLAARDVSHRSSAGLPGDAEVDATCTFRSARNTAKWANDDGSTFVTC